MKQLFFLISLMGGLVLGTFAQKGMTTEETIVFDTEAEKALWDQGQKDIFQLFRAVEAQELSHANNWESLVEELDLFASKNQDQLKMMRQIFQKTHQRLLKKYELHSSFNTMLEVGKYDCVSGSAALGMLLDRYHFDYDIIETDYHVFIVAKLDNKNIILESTLPVGGMITLPSEVEKYLNSYSAQEDSKLSQPNQRLAGPQVDYSNNSIFRKVNLKELAGLQYYNDAIVHFNSQSFGKAVNQLSKAYLLYPSDRVNGLRELSIDLAFKTFGYDLRK